MENKTLRHLNGDLLSESYVSAPGQPMVQVNLEMEKQDNGKAELGLVTQPVEDLHAGATVVQVW